jgi:hypothetical protein
MIKKPKRVLRMRQKRRGDIPAPLAPWGSTGQRMGNLIGEPRGGTLDRVVRRSSADANRRQ